MITNELSGMIIGCAMKVHSELGPGLLENAYKLCLRHELLKRGCAVETEKFIPIKYDGLELGTGYRIDLLVNQSIIVELKCVESLNELHIAQTLTYLKLSNLKLGLLINFNSAKLKDGIKRVINGKI